MKDIKIYVKYRDGNYNVWDKKIYYIELTDKTLKKKISELGTRENHTNCKYK